MTEQRRGTVRTYRDLTAWQKAFDLCADVYGITKRFPRSEVYGLTAQMQRAAVSVPSNIAEGFGRRTTADFLRSLYIAYGSICEVQTQALLAIKLCYLPDQEAGSQSVTPNVLPRPLSARSSGSSLRIPPLDH